MGKKLLPIIFIQILFISVGASIAFYFASGVKFDDFNASISVLQNISAAVFTLTGIWIAYLYPEAISTFTNPEKLTILKGSENAKRIEKLVLIIFTSAFVLVGVLVLNLSFPLLEKSALFVNKTDCLNQFYVGAIIYLSINQLRAISGIMTNNLDFVYRLTFLKTNQDVSDDLNK